jgi:membrane fusion protein, copper/silver efflux system
MKPSATFLWIAGFAGLAIVAGSSWFFLYESDSEALVTIAQDDMPRYRAGGLEIGINTDPPTPRVGDNRLIVDVREPNGNPVSVDIDAYAEMPAMGAMPAMRAPADLEEIAPGRYEGSMDLSMRGEWPLTMRFQTPQGQPVRLQFDLATDRAEIPIAAGGTPIGGANMAAMSSDGLNHGAANAGTAAAGAVKNGTSGMPRYRAGDLEIAIDIDPATAQVGDNKIMIEVRDSDGQPVQDIAIDAYAQMPAMGAMPAMRAPADLEKVGSGRYEGSMDLSMRGEWPLTVEIKDPQRGDKRLQFDLATDREGLAIAAGGTPVGGAAMPADDANVITIDSRRRQMIGVETAQATQRDLVKTIRAVGVVKLDERLLSQVTLKYDGYIGDLKANYVGTEIRKNQVLFTVYNPDLLAAQQEYLDTLKRRANSNTGNGLLRASRQRLALWDMSAGDIKALEQRGAPQDYVSIYAPRSGTLIERNIADGGAAKKGQILLTIADLSRVWVEAEVFETDLELVRVGMAASVIMPYMPGRTYPATVEYVYPYLEEKSRTGRIRLTLDNATGALKPDMYADVSLQANLGSVLTVPEEAVIFAGASRVVFVDLGGGRLKPVRIKAGRTTEGYVEVIEGLSPGDTVVTSGNFLIAAETRLKTGIEQW